MGTPCCRSPALSVAGRLLASPAIISEKNTPMDSAVPEFWKVARMPEAAPRCRGRDAAHDRGGVGCGEHAAADSVQPGEQGENPVGEIHGQQHQAPAVIAANSGY